jgi:hypothetical protein
MAASIVVEVESGASNEEARLHNGYWAGSFRRIQRLDFNAAETQGKRFPPPGSADYSPLAREHV